MNLFYRSALAFYLLTSFLTAFFLKKSSIKFGTISYFQSRIVLKNEMTSGDDIESDKVKLDALDILDCLTSPKDQDHINYDAEKDVR